MTLEKISEEMRSVVEYVSSSYDENQSPLLMGRLTDLSVYLARTAELLSEVQSLYDYQLSIETQNLIADGYSGNALRDIAKGKVTTYKKLLDLTERINSTITHQIDAIRTQLSFLKSLI